MHPDSQCTALCTDSALRLICSSALISDAEARDKISEPRAKAASRPGSKAQSRDVSRPPSAIENNIDYFKEPVVKVRGMIGDTNFRDISGQLLFEIEMSLNLNQWVVGNICINPSRPRSRPE